MKISDENLNDLLNNDIFSFVDKYLKKGLLPDEIIALARKNEFSEEDIKAIHELYKDEYDFYLMEVPTITSYLMALIGGFIGAIFYAIILANIIAFISEYLILTIIFSGLFIGKMIEIFSGNKNSNFFFILGSFFNLLFFLFYKYFLFFIYSIIHKISTDLSNVPIYSKKILDLFINMKYYFPNEKPELILFLLSFIGLYIILPLEKHLKLNKNYKPLSE